MTPMLSNTPTSPLIVDNCHENGHKMTKRGWNPFDSERQRERERAVAFPGKPMNTHSSYLPKPPLHFHYHVLATSKQLREESCTLTSLFSGSRRKACSINAHFQKKNPNWGLLKKDFHPLDKWRW